MKKESAIVVVKRGEKVLILRRSKTERWMPGKWNLPGGRVEEGETPLVAVRRECQEEAGFVPDRLKLLARVEKPFIVLWYFEGTCEDVDVVLSGESDEARWVGKEELNNFEFVPDCRRWIDNVLISSRNA